MNPAIYIIRVTLDDGPAFDIPASNPDTSAAMLAVAELAKEVGLDYCRIELLRNTAFC